jgi:hypothetical protein
MCRCTPSLRTPFCGKPGCTWLEPPAASAPPVVTARELQLLLSNCRKPQEISGDPAYRVRRLGEVVQWFIRFARFEANPRSLKDHAFELAYYVASLLFAEPEVVSTDAEIGLHLCRLHASLDEDSTLTPQEIHNIIGGAARSLFERLSHKSGPSNRSTPITDF